MADSETARAPRLRADAQRNRAQVISAARDVFLEQGPDAPLEEIARRAGVGIATLYRRFPDRDSLIRAILLDGLYNAVAEARTAILEEPDAWSALTRFLRRAVELKMGTFGPALTERLPPQEDFEQPRRELTELVEDLMARALADGRLRSGIGLGDVALMVGMVSRPPAGGAPLGGWQPMRYLELIIDGLSCVRANPLPGEPVGVEEIRHQYR